MRDFPFVVTTFGRQSREKGKNYMNHEGGNVVVATPCVYVNGKRHALRDGIGETTLLEFLRGLFRVSRARLIFYVFFRFCVRCETTRFSLPHYTHPQVKRAFFSAFFSSSHSLLIARVHVNIQDYV